MAFDVEDGLEEGSGWGEDNERRMQRGKPRAAVADATADLRRQGHDGSAR